MLMSRFVLKTTGYFGPGQLIPPVLFISVVVPLPPAIDFSGLRYQYHYKKNIPINTKPYGPMRVLV